MPEPSDQPVVGDAGSLRARGLYVRRFLPVSSAGAPDLLLPIDDFVAARYALRRLLVPTRRWKVARNRLLEALLRLGAVGPIPGRLDVGTRSLGPPFLVAAAAELGVPADARWLLRFGEREFSSRHAFHLFEATQDVPTWVLKFGPREVAERFAADERGLALAQAAGGNVPRLLGRFRAADIEASVETAAVGSRLLDVLAAPGRRAAKLWVLDRLAAWTVELARRTSLPPERLAAERERVATEVLPRWELPGELVRGLPPIRAVLRHGNLGTLNVVVDRDDFTVIDWETATEASFPLWDLAYLLADSLAHLDRAPSGAARERHFVALFSGELASSLFALDWIARGAEASGVPRDAVGRVLTLGWLEEALVNEARLNAAGAATPTLAMRLAKLWLADQALGPGWALRL
jgi:hypothetical protein